MAEVVDEEVGCEALVSREVSVVLELKRWKEVESGWIRGKGF